MPNRTVFTLASILMVLFFLVSNYDRYFFMLHFLESLIYLVIVLLLFYCLEDWAYVVGFVTPLLWIVLTLLNGTLVSGLRALGRLVSFQPVTSALDVLSGLIFATGLGLMLASGWAFRREVWGRPGALRMFLWAMLIVWVYYAVLIAALYRMVKPGA